MLITSIQDFSWSLARIASTSLALLLPLATTFQVRHCLLAT